MNNHYPHSFTGILLILTTHLASSGFQAQAETATSGTHMLFGTIGKGWVHGSSTFLKEKTIPFVSDASVGITAPDRYERSFNGLLVRNSDHTTEHRWLANTVAKAGLDELRGSCEAISSDNISGDSPHRKIIPTHTSTTNTGDNDFRFNLSRNETLSLPVQNQRNDFSVYYSDGGLYIQPLKNVAEYTVIISNLIGQTLHKVRHAGAELYRIDLVLSPSIYIVTIEANGNKFSKKIPVR